MEKNKKFKIIKERNFDFDEVYKALSQIFFGVFSVYSLIGFFSSEDIKSIMFTIFTILFWIGCLLMLIIWYFSYEKYLEEI